VATTRLYRQKVADLREHLPQFTHVLLTDAENDPTGGVLSLHQCMEQVSGKFVIPPTDPEEMAILHFTSGTTGMPKAAIHVHEAVLTHYMTGE
jgi:acetyl-CoA synthetase